LRDVREQQRAVWTAAAKGWVDDREELRGPTRPVTARLIELARIAPGHVVLDMACGSGDPALFIAREVGDRGRVAARDVVAPMVEGARALAQEIGVRNVEFRVIDSELEPRVGTETFDAVTCRFGLMFMADPVAAARAWRASLRPGGRIALSTWSVFPVLAFVREIVTRHVPLPPPDPNAPGVLGLPTPERLVEILQDAGYTHIAVERLRTPIYEPLPPEDWFDLMSRTAGPMVVLLASLPQQVRDAIRADCVQALREQHTSGTVETIGEALLASAVNPG